MKNRVFYLVLCFVSFSMSLLGFADIREIKSMKELEPSVDQDTLVVFDIDNTLISPQGNFGSDQWFYYLYKIYKINGLSDAEIAKKAMSTWNESQWITNVQAVEKDTPAMVSKFQKAGIQTVALTARELAIAERTVSQLKSIGVSFKETALKKASLKISKEDLKTQDDAVMRDGIVYVGESNTKGNVLVTLLKKLNLKPKKIVFVDDRVKHVVGMEKALTQENIPHIAFRYGALDERVGAFNKTMDEVLDQGTAQLFLLGQMIPSEKSRIQKAQSILTQSP